MSGANDKLIKMAEQIAANCSISNQPEVVAQQVADHLNRFWDPRMRSGITQYVANGDVIISDVLRLALDRINVPAT